MKIFRKDEPVFGKDEPIFGARHLSTEEVEAFRKQWLASAIQGNPWPVPPAKDAESSSPITSLSPRPEPEVSQILLDRLIRLEELVMMQGRRLERLLDALAEDQDPDDMPATYLDGSKV